MDWLSEVLADPVLPGWAFLLVALLLMMIPMGPAEPTAVIAGTLVATGTVPPVLAVLTIAAGMLIGDILAYHAGGLIAGRISRSPSGARRLKGWEQRLGTQPVWLGVGIIGLRFLPGARTPAALAAWGAGVSRGMFIPLAATGSILWAGLWVVGGAALVRHVPPGIAAIVLAGAVLVMIVTYGFRPQRLPKRPIVAASHPDGPSTVGNLDPALPTGEDYEHEVSGIRQRDLGGRGVRRSECPGGLADRRGYPVHGLVVSGLL